MQPRTYRHTAELLADRCRVIIPDLFDGHGRWTAARCLDDLEALLDGKGLDRVTLIGHSFGGAIELELAVRCPDRIVELVFADTLAMSHEWTLAAEAVRPLHLLWMATPRAAIDFLDSWRIHPLQLTWAAWWGFTSDRRQQTATVAARGISSHVLWADRDSLLSHADGQAFARDLGASFTVVHAPDGHRIDHDWMYRHPRLFTDEVERLGLKALSQPDVSQSDRTARPEFG
jgi:pimeloyl-ACP methyl ester carboxylesterase